MVIYRNITILNETKLSSHTPDRDAKQRRAMLRREAAPDAANSGYITSELGWLVTQTLTEVAAALPS